MRAMLAARVPARERRFAGAPGRVSGHGGGGTPGPIPNPAVKPSIAESTEGQALGRIGRR